jgi:hypothetical protein
MSNYEPRSTSRMPVNGDVSNDRPLSVSPGTGASYSAPNVPRQAMRSAPYNPLARTIAFSKAMHQESVIVPIYLQTAGEYPVPTFQELVDVAARDQDIFTSVSFIRNRALSRGFRTQCSGDAPNYMRTEAEEFMQDWFENVRWGDGVNEHGFQVLAKDIFWELVAIGASMVEKIWDDRGRLVALAHVQANSIWRYQRDEFGNVVYYWQLPFFNPRPLTPFRYIVWAWNRINREPFGRGLVHPLVQWRTGADGTVMWPVVYRWWQMQDSVARRIQRYGAPHTIYGMKGVSEQSAREASVYLKDPQADSSYITDVEVNVASDAPQGRMNFGPDLEWYTQRFQAGLGTAIVKLLTETDNNRAGSQVKAELEDILIWDAKDAFAQTCDLEIISPVLQDNGFDTTMLKPHLVYNIPDEPEEYTIADVLTAAKPDPTTGKALISLEEARKILRKFAHWELADDPTMAAQPGNLLQPMNQQPQAISQNFGPLPRAQIPAYSDPGAFQIKQPSQNFATARPSEIVP